MISHFGAGGSICTEKQAVAVSDRNGFSTRSSALNASHYLLSGDIAVCGNDGDLILALTTQGLDYIGAVDHITNCTTHNGISSFGTGRCNNSHYLACCMTATFGVVAVVVSAADLTIIASVTFQTGRRSHGSNVIALAAKGGYKVTVVRSLANGTFYAGISLLLASRSKDRNIVAGYVSEGVGIVVAVFVIANSADVESITGILAACRHYSLSVVALAAKRRHQITAVSAAASFTFSVGISLSLAGGRINVIHLSQYVTKARYVVLMALFTASFTGKYRITVGYTVGSDNGRLSVSVTERLYISLAYNAALLALILLISAEAVVIGS